MKNNPNRIASQLGITKSELKQFRRIVQEQLHDNSLSNATIEAAINRCKVQSVHAEVTPSHVVCLILEERHSKKEEEAHQRDETRRCRQELQEHQSRLRRCRKMSSVAVKLKRVQAEVWLRAEKEFDQEKQVIQKELEQAKSALHKAHAAGSSISPIFNSSALVVKEAQRLSFWDIYKECVEKMPEDWFYTFQQDTNNGTNPLTSSQLDQYLAAYGGQHYHKLRDAFARIDFGLLDTRAVEIIDWGCGQAVASCVLLDYLIEQGIPTQISQIMFVDPSSSALTRGISNVMRITEGRLCGALNLCSTNVWLDEAVHHDGLPSIKQCHVWTSADCYKIHLLSNILDIDTVDLHLLCNTIRDSYSGMNKFICLSPKGGERLRQFHAMFSLRARTYDQTQRSLKVAGNIYDTFTKSLKPYSSSLIEHSFTALL